MRVFSFNYGPDCGLLLDEMSDVLFVFEIVDEFEIFMLMEVDWQMGAVRK